MKAHDNANIEGRSMRLPAMDFLLLRALEMPKLRLRLLMERIVPSLRWCAAREKMGNAAPRLIRHRAAVG
jgi:hypothetical protein